MSEHRETVVVACADEATRIFLVDNLIADGYTVVPAETAAQAQVRCARHEPDLLVLGALERSELALELVRGIRTGSLLGPGRVERSLPVLCLLADSIEVARVRALHAGADDVVGMPFSYPELLARVGALLRRCGRPRVLSILRVGELEVDRVSRRVTLADQWVELTGREFALLVTLASAPLRVFTKEELLREVWGFKNPSGVTTRTVDSHACRLRAKLTRPDGPNFMVNVWGVGYRLVDELPESATELSEGVPAAA
jgi:DNA-binding response OmpR family regulator